MTTPSLLNRQPDASRHDPRPEYIRALVERSGLPQVDAAARIGITARALRYYIRGQRPARGGGTQPCLAPYPVQYALERLCEPAVDGYDTDSDPPPV